MKKTLFACLIIALTLSSCKKDNKTQDSKEEQEQKLADEQIAAISLTEVDIYPKPNNCPEGEKKQEAEKCLQNYLTEIYTKALKKYKFAASDKISEPIEVKIKINSEGKIVFQGSNAGEKSVVIEPNLDEVLEKETQGLEKITPAEKQGTKVSVICSLPIVLNVK